MPLTPRIEFPIFNVMEGLSARDSSGETAPLSKLPSEGCDGEYINLKFFPERRRLPIKDKILWNRINTILLTIRGRLYDRE